MFSTRMFQLLATVLVFGLLTSATHAQKKAEFQPTKKAFYKKVGDATLQLHVFEPKDHKASDSRPAIIFFFGGGWVGGSPSQFYPHCDYLASRGMVAISAEYRVKKTHGTTPFDCVRDGKSAIRWVRSHATELGIDPNHIAVGGGSAGGHVAAATGTVPALEQEGEDQSVSCKPNALALFNPVYDNGPTGYGYDRVREHYKDISPMHNISKETPPAIVFLGTKDSLIPVATAKSFQAKMKEAGCRSELMLFEGQPHGFFNYGKGDAYRHTVFAMDQFLQSLDYLEGNPSIDGSGHPPILK
jgi:acetyl esterase